MGWKEDREQGNSSTPHNCWIPFVGTSLAYHVVTGSVAIIGKLPALGSQYFGIFISEFSGIFISVIDWRELHNSFLPPYQSNYFLPSCA